jgi:hypothetical protein
MASIGLDPLPLPGFLIPGPLLLPSRGLSDSMAHDATFRFRHDETSSSSPQYGGCFSLSIIKLKKLSVVFRISHYGKSKERQD